MKDLFFPLLDGEFEHFETVVDYDRQNAIEEAIRVAGLKLGITDFPVWKIPLLGSGLVTQNVYPVCFHGMVYSGPLPEVLDELGIMVGLKNLRLADPLTTLIFIAQMKDKFTGKHFITHFHTPRKFWGVKIEKPSNYTVLDVWESDPDAKWKEGAHFPSVCDL